MIDGPAHIRAVAMVRFQIGKNVRRYIKETHAKVSPDQEISLEILEILESFYFLKRERPDSDDALENLRTLRCIRLLHDDVVLRLSKLAEDDSRSWSFSQALKKLRKHSAHTFVEATINNQIRKFRDLIRPIRDHRDSYIAHHSKRHRAHLKPPELLPAIRLAVEITDALAEHEVTYRLGDIDLRKDILGHPKATIKHGA